MTVWLLLLSNLAVSVYCEVSHYQGDRIISATLGDTISLTCLLKSTESCIWEKDSISIIERFGAIYSENHNSNCSIQIKGVTKEDEGEWKCLSYADLEKIAVFIVTIQDSNNHTYMDNKQTRYLTSNVGEELTLFCKLKTRGSCFWKRNYIQIQSEDPYSYGEINHISKNKICFIRINGVMRSDEGVWQCSSRATSLHDNEVIGRFHVMVNSVTAQITVSKHPKNTSAVLGDTIKLECEFSDAVDCIWKRNHEVVLVKNRMKYMGNRNGNNTKDCSIEINNVTNEDSASWICSSTATDEHDIISANVTIKGQEENMTHDQFMERYLLITIMAFVCMVVIILAVILKKYIAGKRRNGVEKGKREYPSCKSSGKTSTLDSNGYIIPNTPPVNRSITLSNDYQCVQHYRNQMETSSKDSDVDLQPKLAFDSISSNRRMRSATVKVHFMKDCNTSEKTGKYVSNNSEYPIYEEIDG